LASDATDAVTRLDATALRQRTSCGDGEIVWRSWGAGPPLVLLHGGIGSWRHWVRTIDQFAPQHRVIAPDTPGLGDSSAPPPPHTPQQLAAWLGIGLATMLQGERGNLVGFSFGAMLAGQIAAQRPELIDSLTVVGAGGLGLPRANVKLVRVLDKTGAEREAAHRTNLQNLMLAKPESVDVEALAIQDVNSRLARIRSVAFSTTAALSEALARVSAPVHAIWGKADAVAALNLAARLEAIRALRPGARVTVIPGAGHWVAYEAPDAFAAALATGLHVRSAAP
jgi:pimeloyl-ACP methyl ester carboxylesterase